MTEVEDLKVAAPPHKGHRADDHDGEQDDEDDASGVGPAVDEPEDHGLARHHPVAVGVGRAAIGAVLAQHVGQICRVKSQVSAS